MSNLRAKVELKKRWEHKIKEKAYNWEDAQSQQLFLLKDYRPTSDKLGEKIEDTNK